MRLIDADKLKLKMEFINDMSPKGLIKDRVMVSYDNIDNAPTVDAIPIEWMYEWRAEKITNKNVGISSFSQMIRDWERENGN